MKRSILTKLFSRVVALLMAAVLCVSCNVDDSYDLSTINDDEMGIGTDDTEFNLPLVSVNVDLASILGITYDDDVKGSATRSEGDDVSYDKLVASIDDLSSLMPTGESIDIKRLNADTPENEAYIGEVVDALFEELESDEEKCYKLCKMATSGDYDDMLLEINELTGDDCNISTSSSDEELLAAAANLNATLKTTSDDELKSIKGEVTTATTNATSDIDVINVDRAIDGLEIDQDTIDLIIKNLDGKKNKIYLRIVYGHDLPFGLSINTVISFDEGAQIMALRELGDANTEADEIKTKEILEKLLEGFSINTTVDIDSYLPNGEELAERIKGKKLKATLIVTKTGSLKF